MVAQRRKWSRHVHVKQGALGGWCERCPAAKRHSALRSIVKRQGYATAIRRLGFLRNVASRKTNLGLEKTAARDIRWAQKHLRGARSS
jgi:hypothetical protein